ncbi:GAF domain-containing protein [[Clostridium] innocuum]|nr:GAF domain-containing protein [[Clostridium] innocuum]
MKEKQYERILQQLCAVLEGEHDMIANMANMSALLFAELPELNWAGFYLFKNKELILGPFQGRVACMHIPLGKGVCGVCAESRCTQRVDNVHEFVNHIACDSASNSEIVIPLIKEDTLLGVLDIDSPVFSRFDAVDQHYLEKAADILLQSL